MSLHLDATAARLDRANLLQQLDTQPAIERPRRANLRLVWFVVRRPHWARRARHAWKMSSALAPTGGALANHR